MMEKKIQKMIEMNSVQNITKKINLTLYQIYKNPSDDLLEIANM